MENVDRNKLLLEYQKLLKRLDSAENWAIEHKFNWDDVKTTLGNFGFSSVPTTIFSTSYITRNDGKETIGNLLYITLH